MPDETPKKVLDASHFLTQLGLGQQGATIDTSSPAHAPDPWGNNSPINLEDIIADKPLVPSGPSNLVEKPSTQPNIIDQTKPENITKPENYVQPLKTEAPHKKTPEEEFFSDENTPPSKEEIDAAQNEKAEGFLKQAEYQNKGFFGKMIPDSQKFWASMKAGLTNTAAELLPKLGALGIVDEPGYPTNVDRNAVLKYLQTTDFINNLKDKALDQKKEADKIYGEGGIGSWGLMLGGIALSAAAAPFTEGTSLSFIPAVISAGTTAMMVGDVVGNSYLDQDQYAKEHGIKIDPVKRDVVALGSGLTMAVAGEVVGGGSKMASKFAQNIFGKTIGSLIQDSSDPLIDLMRKYIAKDPQAVSNVIKHLAVSTGKEVAKSGATMGGMTAVNDLLANIYKNPDDRQKFKSLVKDTFKQIEAGGMMGLLLGPFAEGQSAMYNHMRQSEKGIDIVQTKDGKVYERVGDDPKNPDNVTVIDKNLDYQSIPRKDISGGFSMTPKEKVEYLDTYKNNQDAMPEIEKKINENAIRRHTTEIGNQVAFEGGPKSKTAGTMLSSAIGKVVTVEDANGDKYFVKRFNPDGSAVLVTLTPKGDGTYKLNGFTVKNLDQSKLKPISVKEYSDMATDYYSNIQPAGEETQPGEQQTIEQPSLESGVTVPKTETELNLETEKQFGVAKENMQQFRSNADIEGDSDLHLWKDQEGKLWYKIEQQDFNTALYASAESGDMNGTPAKKAILATSTMQHISDQKYEEWADGMKANIQAGLAAMAQAEQQKQQEEASKPVKSPENSYTEEYDNAIRNNDTEGAQAIRDRVTDDMAQGKTFADPFLEHLQIAKPEGEAVASPAQQPGTDLSSENKSGTGLVTPPKSFPVNFDDKKLLPAKAIEQPNGTYLLDQTYPTLKEAKKIKAAFDDKFENLGYVATVESKGVDPDNPFADQVHSIRINIKPNAPKEDWKGWSQKEFKENLIKASSGSDKELSDQVAQAAKAHPEWTKPEPVKPADSEKVKKLRERKWPMSKADESRIAQEPQSFAMAVYQFFLSGGRIKTDDLNRYLRKETGEKGGDKMLWAHAKDGISLDKLHEMPQFEQFMTGMTGVDGVNAFIDVLNSVKGKKDIRTKLDALLANNGQPAPEQVPQDEQENIDADQEVSVLNDIVAANPKLIDIFMEYSDSNDDIDWNEIARLVSTKPEWFTDFPFNLSEKELQDLKNILTDDSKKRELQEFYKANGSPQSKAQRDQLFPGSEQDEGGIRTKPSQEQSGSEKQQVEPAEVKAPEETPAEVKPEEKPQENIPVKQEFAGEALSELPPMDMEELMAMDFADEDITKAKIKCIKLPKGGITL